MSVELHSVGSPPGLRLTQRIRQVPWSLIILITMVASIGFAMLYSAAGGDADRWMNKQVIRFAVGICVMITIGMVDLQRLAKIAYPLYGVAFILLVYVEFAGEVGMGAQRWIDLKFFQLQPSELMKISLCLVLARYFHSLSYEEIGRPWVLIMPTLLVVLPAGLVLKQPDLGTAGMLLMAGGAIFFVAGVRWWKFAIVFALGIVGAVGAWNSGFLHDYQKARLLTFLDPSRDALGTGYHITQSKIALGSGGVWGKGLMQGSQAQLNFLPERHTDFIFTMLGEELGMVGGLLVLALYSLLVVYGLAIALRTRSHFGRLLAFGVTMNIFLYFFINTAMVMGLIPVVGIPLPLISYGGTALMTVMVGFGLLMSVYVHRDYRVGRRTSGED
ncbi:rod shape-determining protein RodA [Dongia deserti]|uniref:rod shape-determining protein RodA n=1 Tax=Dongia deserti TaxID=2268030 RepID=UPI000E6485EC|nr:rod shape-determining protein RodA [Dongia deserti]